MKPNWKLAVLRILPKKWLSSLAGKWASSRLSRPFIPLYIRMFKIDPSLAEHPAGSYENLTAFFTRRLRPELRPIHADADAVISPVDGIASELGEIAQGTLLQAKGVTYTVASLLDSQEAAESFEGGQWVTLYLSPRDYHRIHSPLDGSLVHSVYVPGTLWPVNPVGVQGVPGLFSKNERIITYLQTPAGRIAIVKVGATIVGSIDVHYDPALGTNQKGKRMEKAISPPVHVKKGEEIGLFKFGSTVILLFEPDMVTFDAGLKSGVFVEMGTRIGTLPKK